MPRTPDGHAVVIAGAGPTGLMLAAELALAGVDVAVVERRPTQDLAGSRAGGLHARSLELLDQRGLVDRFLAPGQRMPDALFGGLRLALGDLPTRHPYVLALRQQPIERLLAQRADELAVTLHRGVDVAGFAQDDAGVDVRLSDGRSLRASWLVGCDGGRSVVRKAAGIAFPGWDATTSSLVAEVEMAERPEWGIRRDARGVHALTLLEDGRRVGVMLTEPQVGHGEPTLDDLREALVAVHGRDYGVRGPAWVSRFTDATRQAAAYRERRVLLAGDAAHVHAPDGGQGLNLGLHDAVNLGWKLATVVKGNAPDTLLDTYHAERHPVAARLLRKTMALGAMRRPDERSQALRDTVAELLAHAAPRRALAAALSGLDIRHDLGDGHPLLGRRVPDLALVTADGPRRVHALLHDAHGVLLDFGLPGGVGDIRGWAGRVRTISATFAGAWELPVVGAIDAPAAVLVRPDGHVAWVGDTGRAGLVEALATWFGPPAA